MIKITLDTSAIELSNPVIIELKRLKKEGKIYLGIDIHQYLEKDNWENQAKEEVLDFIIEYGEHPSQAFWLSETEDPSKAIEKKKGYSLQEEQQCVDKLMGIMHHEINIKNPFPNKRVVNHYVDIELLKDHILQGREYFITKNIRDFIKNGRKEALEKEFSGLKIREPDENLLKEIKIILGKEEK